MEKGERYEEKIIYRNIGNSHAGHFFQCNGIEATTEAATEAVTETAATEAAPEATAEVETEAAEDAENEKGWLTVDINGEPEEFELQFVTVGLTEKPIILNLMDSRCP